MRTGIALTVCGMLLVLLSYDYLAPIFGDTHGQVFGWFVGLEAFAAVLLVAGVATWHRAARRNG